MPYLALHAESSNHYPTCGVAGCDSSKTQLRLCAAATAFTRWSSRVICGTYMMSGWAVIHPIRLRALRILKLYSQRLLVASRTLFGVVVLVVPWRFFLVLFSLATERILGLCQGWDKEIAIWTRSGVNCDRPGFIIGCQDQLSKVLRKTWKSAPRLFDFATSG
jgi:hypothetical protein